jgi:hypothetical protein
MQDMENQLENNKEIQLVQSPIIRHQLKEAGKEVSKRIAELNLDNQLATVQTVKFLKDLRAELNKDLADFETQRKLIKTAVNNPYIEFEDLYKTEISEKYKTAIDTLKDKIATVEDKIKSDKKKEVESYFNELCIAEKIDFIKFDKLGIDINLSTTEKKYKEQVNEYISKVIDDLNLIKSTDFEAEILTEYKSSLNVSNAITSVKTRKENEAKEVERLKAEQRVNRINYIEKLGMRFFEITNSYDFNADIYISLDDINSLSKEDFTKKYLDLEARIKDVKAKELEEKRQLEAKQKADQVSESPIIECPIIETPKVVAPPISAPIVEVAPEPIKTASFEVKATMTKLRALGEFMKTNGIIYKNI